VPVQQLPPATRAGCAGQLTGAIPNKATDNRPFAPGRYTPPGAVGELWRFAFSAVFAAFEFAGDIRRVFQNHSGETRA